ncbi:hypothetical protein OLX02_01400 [Novosphingobium sp. KCTC 2891]|uniref:hypothetical protein n=1 Tax=Novosphingobium sp. KCTC 2891 TaxID=2989730 RepID=UPI002223BE80|nr:hypothetical protein [Novosphingobium sp. KCTC 2891]MCW1381469.1 hypothetical protein [Novosphingobium sp. KCTC 2891]
MNRLHAVLAPLAVLQMAAPAPSGAAFLLVPICGEAAGHVVPIRVPAKNDAPGGAPCCKICHISMRKRIGGDSCCGEEDDPDVA